MGDCSSYGDDGAEGGGGDGMEAWRHSVRSVLSAWLFRREEDSRRARAELEAACDGLSGARAATLLREVYTAYATETLPSWASVDGMDARESGAERSIRRCTAIEVMAALFDVGRLAERLECRAGSGDAPEADLSPPSACTWSHRTPFTSNDCLDETSIAREHKVHVENLETVRVARLRTQECCREAFEALRGHAEECPCWLSNDRLDDAPRCSVCDAIAPESRFFLSASDAMLLSRPPTWWSALLLRASHASAAVDTAVDVAGAARLVCTLATLHRFRTFCISQGSAAVPKAMRLALNEKLSEMHAMEQSSSVERATIARAFTLVGGAQALAISASHPTAFAVATAAAATAEMLAPITWWAPWKRKWTRRTGHRRAQWRCWTAQCRDGSEVETGAVVVAPVETATGSDGGFVSDRSPQSPRKQEHAAAHASVV